MQKMPCSYSSYRPKKVTANFHIYLYTLQFPRPVDLIKPPWFLVFCSPIRVDWLRRLVLEIPMSAIRALCRAVHFAPINPHPYCGWGEILQHQVGEGCFNPNKIMGYLMIFTYMYHLSGAGFRSHRLPDGPSTFFQIHIGLLSIDPMFHPMVSGDHHGHVEKTIPFHGNPIKWRQPSP